MAHSATTNRKLEGFLIRAVQALLPDLAQFHLALGEELLETEDAASALAQRALITAVDAIGKVRFPREWQHARDNAGIERRACCVQITGTQNLCTRDDGHSGSHRCSAADVDSRLQEADGVSDGL